MLVCGEQFSPTITMPLVTLENIKLKTFDRSQSMPLYEPRKPTEFQLVRDSIRKRTFSLQSTQRPPSISEDTSLRESGSLTSVTSSNSNPGNSSPRVPPTDWRRLELRRARSLTSSSKTSFEIPQLRSTRSCQNQKQYQRELEQGETYDLFVIG